MKTISVLLFIMAIVATGFSFQAEKQLQDCQDETILLEARIRYLENLHDLIPAIEQVCTAEMLAQFGTVTEMIRQKKDREYERHEQPIIERK